MNLEHIDYKDLAFLSFNEAHTLHRSIKAMLEKIAQLQNMVEKMKKEKEQ